MGNDVSHGNNNSFLHAAVIHIPKNIHVNLARASNYRAIALSIIFSIIVDRIIMSIQSDYLMTSELHFHSSITLFYYTVWYFT